MDTEKKTGTRGYGGELWALMAMMITTPVSNVRTNKNALTGENVFVG